ncbi:hypothetical protein [Burkholderia cenocepacia]|uniref:hypothetical protein n=1 Tax=Burkholderia cenocepacia TaxID=95486 RepID=UPI002232146C|nr:hypothetical protein [Burkholderia cenocepacia]MCW3632882.1 hypothetical protein [Burkholderia cenocepacia]MCW5182336.1 hypothetical protein [Burkholderia cenocepacia]
MFEQTSHLPEETRLSRHVLLIVIALMVSGVALLAFSTTVQWRLIGALFDGISIGFFAASKLAVWKA